MVKSLKFIAAGSGILPCPLLMLSNGGKDNRKFGGYFEAPFFGSHMKADREKGSKQRKFLSFKDRKYFFHDIPTKEERYCLPVAQHHYALTSIQNCYWFNNNYRLVIYAQRYGNLENHIKTYSPGNINLVSQAIFTLVSLHTE